MSRDRWAPRRRLSAFLLSLGVLVAAAPSPDGRAQVRPVYSRGVVGLVQQLHRLQTTASAMHTGAHPDDEDTSLIARLARGDHARVAYLSLTRGDGGQNIIGPELFEALGVIRTEELLQARTLDGGEQLFTRAMDFGYTKTRAETAEKWGEERILGDMVWAIRRYRPLVIISRFSGTDADGHGQHQMAGYLTPLAFRAAADPARFPEQIEEGLRPWQARKLYVGEGFRPDPSNPTTVRVQTGAYDPLLGRSYTEVAIEGRSQHKSQQMGGVEVRGPRSSGLRLVESVVPKGQTERHVAERVPATEPDVFEGLDTSVPGLARLAGLPEGALENELLTMDRAAKRALDSLEIEAPEGIVSPLAEGLRAVRAARRGLDGLAAADPSARAEADFLLEHKEREFEEALVRAAGLVVDALSNTETVATGESFVVTVKAYVDQPAVTELVDVALTVPPGWEVVPSEPVAPADQGPFARFFREHPDREEAYRVTVPRDAAFTQPYWLETGRSGDVFTWPTGAPRTQPFRHALAHGRITAEIGGVSVTLVVPVEYRFADRIRGELRRDLNVVPAVSVELASNLEIVPVSRAGEASRVAVRVQSHAARALAGHARLVLPGGWTSVPAEVPFELAASGARTAAVFMVRAPADLSVGSYRIRAEALVDGERFDTAMQTVAYPHIQTHRLYRAAEALVQAVDLGVAPVTVGYIMGSGDRVPEAIERLGLEVTLLEADDLRTGDLSRFDTVVVGIRASQARPDFVANNGRLLDYVRAGGSLVVQYQQTDYVRRDLTPLPAEMRSRVSVETAPVRMLEASHPVFTYPNRITDDDWGGWVQERNLYAFTSFDPAYTPLLESNDPGEAPQRGGQVYVRLGKGHYLYTSYAWFRQLPAGVPGAYRMFANLLSLPRAPAASDQ